jgi:serine/threonine protein kinase
MDDLIGRTLKGTYEIQARLGEGSMGTVYRALDTATGRPIAIKIMQPARMREPGMLTRFRREATAMRRVRHPNAVEVIAHGVDQGLVYLAMELVEGIDLADHLAIEKRLTPERAARIVVEVCAALAVAHAHGVVHRDIKPENIMLGAAGGAVKLLDFGIAKPTKGLACFGAPEGEVSDERSVNDSIPDDVDLADSLELTTAGMLIGSPGYMAPEQWSSRPVDARTDVYACGAVLFQLVTGRLPFEDDNPFMVAHRQLHEEPTPPHELSHDVPLSLSAIIFRALRPAPEDRWQSVGELRDALRAFLVERTLAAAMSLDATVPFEVMSPFPDPPSVRVTPLPALPRQDVEPLARTLVLPEAPVVPLPEYTESKLVRIAAAASSSVGRNGRASSVPPPALARTTLVPPAGANVVMAQLRVLLPLCAAFLTLGFVIGMLILFPGLR